MKNMLGKIMKKKALMKVAKKRIIAFTAAALLLMVSSGCTASDEVKNADGFAEAGTESITGESADNGSSIADSEADTDADAGTAGSSDDFAGYTGDNSIDLTGLTAYEAEVLIASQGRFLYSGSTDRGYYPSDISWLRNAGDKESLAIAYACDDESHAGWGVLGISAGTASGQKQIDIPAYSYDTSRERFILYTVAELAEEFGLDSISDIKSFQIGAWNGGRLAGVYFLDEQVTEEFMNYREQNAANQIVHTYNGNLSNPNAAECAVEVYRYIQENYGNACLTGQMESTWMGSADYEMDYVMNVTGKLPAIRGFDFIHNDFDNVADRAEKWWDKGGIVTICWHTGAGFDSGYNECLADTPDLEKALTPGTAEYEKLIAGIDRAVPALQRLQEEGVPVLWRPFHELDGGWFWWSKSGGEQFIKLWKLMYTRYTEYWGLNNLIWVLGYSSNGVDISDWYPGDEYVDLIGADSYNPGANEKLYKLIEKLAPEGMPVVYHECGTIPTENEMTEAGAKWTYFMVWTTEYITDSKYNTPDSLRDIYNSDYFITLDELPDFK